MPQTLRTAQGLSFSYVSKLFPPEFSGCSRNLKHFPFPVHAHHSSVLSIPSETAAAVTDEAQKKGAHAGNLIKAIAGLVGGGGGGRPNMAQAGGKNPEGVADALVKVAEVVSEQVK